MTIYQAIVLANTIAQDNEAVKNYGEYLVLDNLIGDCFRALKAGQDNIEGVYKKWNCCKLFALDVIQAAYSSAKAIFDNCRIETD